MRVGELLALRVEDVNFLRRTLRVEFQREQRSGKRVVPKTPRSRRTLPLPAMVGNALAAHIQQFSPHADGSLFTRESGMPLHYAEYQRAVILRAVRKLVAEDPMFPADTSTHALRHHYTSVLLAAGESVIAVAERLGHENAALVLSTYGHLMPDSEDRTLAGRRRGLQRRTGTDCAGRRRTGCGLRTDQEGTPGL